MSVLRLMTFNVQILPLLGQLAQGQSDDAEDRANRVSTALLAIPPHDRPHVIAFNEIFSEPGRDVLINRLQGEWNHIIQTIHDGGLEEESGLMLMSSLPFQILPTGGNFHERFFRSAAADDDAKASKGVGIVQVSLPAERTTIAFTHMQASYINENQYDDVRRKQLETIHSAITEVVGSGSATWRNVILVGDLNIRGDSGALTGEWASVFKISGLSLTTELLDGWHAYMHPPAPYDKDIQNSDPGYTNLDFASGKLQRLDYLCSPILGIPAERYLVPHHMFTRIRNASDHFALEAVVQRWSPHCTPSDAIDLRSIKPQFGDTAGLPSNTRRVDLNLADPGSMQWVYVDQPVGEPGTFSVNSTPDLEIRLFLRSDLSQPVARIDTLAVADLPAVLQAAFDERIDPKGETFVVREPFFIAVRSPNQVSGPEAIIVTEHLGDSPATAIWLMPHVRAASSFPQGQLLGDDDLCWFKASMPRTFSGTSRIERFISDNATGSTITLTALDSAGQPADFKSGAAGELELTRTTLGDELIFFTLGRSDDQKIGFGLTWKSPVSYLMLEQPLGLRITDESGWDWPGDDEILLAIQLDGEPLYDGDWDDADTGEGWPGLAEAIQTKCAVQFPGTNRIGFSSDLNLDYMEVGFEATGSSGALMYPLAEGEADIAPRLVSLEVPDTVSNGTYTFYCSITRFG